MSVNRYVPTGDSMENHPAGGWVLFDDYAALQAEVQSAATDAGLLAARLLVDAACGDFGHGIDEQADEARSLAVRLRSLSAPPTEQADGN